MRFEFTSFPSSGTFDLDYSGYWYYKSKCGQRWYRLEFLNWADTVGYHEAKDGDKYNVEVKEIWIDHVTFTDIEGALSYVGSLEKDASEITPFEMIYALFEYGTGEQTFSVSGNNSKQLLRDGRAEIRSSL